MRLALMTVAAVVIATAGCGGGTTRVERIDLASAPSRVVVGGGSLWVATAGGTLERLDARGKRRGAVDLSGSPEGLAFGEGGVWFATASNDSVYKVDPRSLRRVAGPVKVGDLSGGENTPIAAGAGGVWVGAEDSLVRLDPRTGRQAGDPIRVDGFANGIAIAGGRVWVLIGIGTKRVPTDSPPDIDQRIVPDGQDLESDATRDHTLVAIDPARRRLVGPRVKLGGTGELGSGPSGLWLAGGEAVQRLSPATGRPVGKRIDVGKNLANIAVGEGAVWVSSPGNAVFRVDPKGEVSEPIVMETSNAEGVSAEIGDIAAGLGSVWIGSELEDALGRVDPKDVE